MAINDLTNLPDNFFTQKLIVNTYNGYITPLYTNGVVLADAAPIQNVKIEPPEGYKIVEDLNYVIKKEDLFYNSEFDIKFRKIDLSYHGHGPRLVGYTIKDVKDTWIFYSHAGYIIASKKEIKPRFPCDKPYPYGY